jgi:iron(III) transport system permease protein
VGRRPLRSTTQHSRWHPRPWLTAALATVLVAGGLPLVWLAVEAARSGAPLITAMLAPRTLGLLANTVLLGVAVAGLAGLAGTALAILAVKTDLPFRGALSGLVTFPLFLPPFVLALGWFAVFGREGLISAWAGPDVAIRTSALFFGLPGAVLVLVVAYTPITFHLVRAGLAAVDPSIEEAARLHGRWPRVVRRVDVPFVVPAIAFGMLVTFVLVIGELGVPAFLRYPVFAGEVFTQFAAFLDVRSAVAMSVPLGLLVLGGLAIERVMLRERVLFLPRHRLDPMIAPLGRWRATAGIGAWTWMLLIVLLPLVGLVTRAGGFENYRRALGGAGSSIVRTLWLSTIAATGILILGLLLGYLVERTRPRRRDGVDTLLLLVFAAPGTVLGVGLILVWNRAGLDWLYGSAAIIVVGWVAHLTPLAARIVGLALRGLPLVLEEAARIARVTWGRTLRQVVLPSISRALAAAWMLAFIFCLRDLDLTITIYPPGAETLPVRLYTLMANSPEPVIAALAILIVGLTAVFALAGCAAIAALRRTDIG